MKKSYRNSIEKHINKKLLFKLKKVINLQPLYDYFNNKFKKLKHAKKF